MMKFTITKKRIIITALLVGAIAVIWGGAKVWHSQNSSSPEMNPIVEYSSSTDAPATSSLAFSTSSVENAAARNGGVNPPLMSASGEITLTGSGSTAFQELLAGDRKDGFPLAPQVVSPAGFINAPSTFTLRNLVGKNVVLLDFWTYSNINSVRTIPFLNALYAKYKDAGLEIVGIHTPEFDFEKNTANVAAAVVANGIQFPVILDNIQGTWNAYNNLYWPHAYLIDLSGHIVYDHIGEGDYATIETDLQYLLAQRAQILGMASSSVPGGNVDIPSPALNGANSPETYFGADRNSALANGEYFVNGVQTLPAAPGIHALTKNYLYLTGTWNFENQYATNQSAGAEITFEYDSSKVYLVAGGAPGGTKVEVLQDGSPIASADAGSDVENGIMTITKNGIYRVVHNSAGSGVHVLQLIVDTPGLHAYTFTFE